LLPNISCRRAIEKLEVHTEPEKSIVDADQTIGVEEFSLLMLELKKIANVVGRKI